MTDSQQFETFQFNKVIDVTYAKLNSTIMVCGITIKYK
jgi:hypothetical protein